MSPHAIYIVPNARPRRRSLWATLASAILAVLLLALLVLGTIGLIAWIDAMQAAPESAFLQGMAAGVNICGTRL
jgi:hypothetical protein